MSNMEGTSIKVPAGLKATGTARRSSGLGRRYPKLTRTGLNGWSLSSHRKPWAHCPTHVFTKAVQWGYIDPFKGEVRLQGEKPRDRYVEDWEIIECLAMESKRKKGSILAIQAHIRMKLLTGLARGDLLQLDPTPGKSFTAEGILVTRHKTENKTGKTTIYE
jgi:hypothetical protein